MLAQQGMSYSTARMLVASGRAIRGCQAPSGTIIVEAVAQPHTREDRVAIYARVSSAEHCENLERQVERLSGLSSSVR